jgi:hypothetical protein
MSSKGHVQLLEKVSNKLRPLIRNDHHQNPVQTYHTSVVDLDILLNSILGVNEYEVGGFGESIHNHPNHVKLAASPQQVQNEVHANDIPFPFYNAQRLQ